MPLIFIVLILVALCVCFAVYVVKKEGAAWFEKRGINIVIFAFSFISLIISLTSFWNIAKYVDEYGTSPTVVYGGEIGLYMAWLELGALFVICIISGLKLLITHSK